MVSYLSVSAIWLPNWELVASGEKVVVLYPHFFMRRGVRTEAAINCGLIQKPTNVIELKLPYPLKVYPPQARSSGVWLWRKEWLEVAIDLDVK